MPKPTDWQLQEQQFWDFSLRLYSQSSVMETCLCLQDEYQLNVNMVLFCCFAHHLSLPLNRPFITALHQAAERTDAHIVAHRQQRKQYKQRAAINQGEMFDPAHYQLLKQQELALEKQQQSHLIDAAQTYQAQLSLDNEQEASCTENTGLALYVKLFAVDPELNVAADHAEPKLSDLISTIQLANQSLNLCSEQVENHVAPK